MTRTDPRDLAANFLEKDAKQEASVSFPRIPWFHSPPLSPLFGSVRADQRALASNSVTRFRLLIPSNEWDTSTLPQWPDYIVLSNFDTMHSFDRLKLPEPVAYMKQIPADYSKIVFNPKGVWGYFRLSPIIPEDLLYVMPTITIYKNLNLTRVH